MTDELTQFSRIISMTYGRPFMIDPSLSLKSTLCFSTQSEETVTSQGEEGACPNNSPDYLAFYFQTLKHVEILRIIVSTFYREADGSSLPLDRSQRSCRPGVDNLMSNKQTRKLGSADFQALLELEESLSAWKEQLPQHLRVVSEPEKRPWVEAPPDSASEMTKIYARQANVLQAR